MTPQLVNTDFPRDVAGFRRRGVGLWVLLWIALCGGCMAPTVGVHRDEQRYLDVLARDVHFSDMTSFDAPHVDRFGAARPPNSLANGGPQEYWDLTLDEAIQIALMNSQVLRDFGGTVLTQPTGVATVYDPAIVETDPRFGVEAALSEFDAQVSMFKRFLNNDRAINNELIGGGTRILQQDLHAYRTELSKQTAGGTRFTVRHNTDYDANNQPSNLFPNVWNVNVEGEFRHPLLQGSGAMFNRTAGPNGAPGQISGVVVARLNTDISLADFEARMRDFVSDVENAYWELYFTYRELDVKLEARDRALKTWRAVEAQGAMLPGGVADREAQAREQYYRFEEDVKNSLSGRTVPRSSSRLGVAPNLFSTQSGVFTAERNLRLLLGLPTNDGKLLRPAKDPVIARYVFDWNEATAEALTKRPELKRQRSQVKRQELELMATRHFLMPRLDAVGTYRFRGFGDDLLNSERGRPRFDNAYADLTTGDFQEWELGVELTFPIGFRRAHSAVRNSQLQLARAKALLREQERMVVHDLSNAVAELERSWALVQTTMNRLAAAKQQLDVLEQRETLGITVDLNLLLDAQRRKADAGRGYFRALAEYALALKNVHYTKGSLMEYNNVFFSSDVANPSAGGSAPAPAAQPMLTPPQPQSPTPGPQAPPRAQPQIQPLPTPSAARGQRTRPSRF